MATTNNDIISNVAPTAMTTTAPNASVTAVAGKKQKASEDKARREEHLLHLIEGTTWQNADNFTVEENILKQIIGFDPSVLSVDMLHKICGKLGFVSHKYTKNVCLKFLKKAYKDLQSYDVLEPNRNSSMVSTSVSCHLLNIIMSDTLVARFQMLGGRKGMAELDRGGAGQDKAFWEDVALEFNDYSPQEGL